MNIITTKLLAYEKVNKHAKNYGVIDSEIQFACYEVICEELEKNGRVDPETYIGIFECMSIKQNIHTHLDIIEDHENCIDLLIERCNHWVVNTSPTGIKYCRGCGQFL